ncbi:MAG TPA: LamG-like jellyroll fold domain-containing protein [Bacteroidia bacterium]|nr:LamG-like jellyroll fold domain-containing protein [Bacteroidia bacterium]
MKNFTVILLLVLITTGSRAQINLSQGLQAQYDFNGNANDITGNGYDGTINGAALTNDRLGNPNSAYHFDGTNQNITVQGFQNMITGDEISLSCWIKVDFLKSQNIFMLSPDDHYDRLFVSSYYDHNGTSSTFLDYGDMMTGDGRLGSVGTNFQSVWEHYVFIVSASQNTMEIYRNGYLQFFKTGMSPLVNKNRTLCIGGGMGDFGFTNFFFSGIIDDIRIYDRVLNPAEIMSLCYGYYTTDVKDLRVFVTNYPNARPGFPEMLNVVYQNVGTTIQNCYVELNYDSHYSFVQSTPAQDSVNTNYLGWNIANLMPGASGYFQAEMYLPASIPLGTQLTSTGIIYPVIDDTIPADNYDTLIQTVVGGCDPNYIEVSPNTDVTPGFVTQGDYLYYTIHFQNTGTASAINVRVENNIEADFTVSSVEIIGASHAYTFTLDNSNMLTFFFDNINLPDSGSSYFGSSGFVMYRIKALPTLQIGDQLSNNANIFFDFNQPVLTNTVVTTIVSPLSIPQAQNNSENFILFPNPSGSSLSLIYYSQITEPSVSISIFNSNGALVKKIIVDLITGKNKIDLDLKTLNAGIYFIKSGGGNNTTVKKWVKF